MYRTVSFGGVNAHLIYTFNLNKQRPLYPMESDYVATCAVNEKTFLLIDRLELFGLFEQEYSKKSDGVRNHIFRKVVLQLRSCVKFYKPKSNDIKIFDE